MIPHASPRWDQGQSLSGFSAALGASASVQVSLWVLLGREGQSALYMLVSVCSSEDQQAEWGRGSTDSHDQQPATGEAGIQEQLLGRWVSEASCGWEPHCTCVHVYSYL